MKLANLENAVSAALLVGAMALTQSVHAQELPETSIKVVGSGSHTYTHKTVEAPFWTEELPAASGGAMDVSFTGLVESGLQGPEIIRLMRLGAIDFAHGVFGFVSGDDPTFEGIDLAGVIPTLDSARQVAEAYKPVIDRSFREEHGIKLLAVLPYSAQVFFCTSPVESLNDLSGLKVRVFGASMADFVSELGAQPVTLPFAEVVTALQTGVIDCAVSGIASGNGAKWFEVAKHLFNMPVGWSLSFYAVNAEKWESLDPKVREFLQQEIARMEDEVWEATARENEFALACNTGADSCEVLTKADMTAVEPSPEDEERRKEIAAEVAKGWQQRCGEECASAWDETVGSVVGLDLN